MPTYEYRCTGCGRHIEAHQSFTDPPLQKCEVCGEKLRRIFSPVGVLFKGSGFYSTDARSSAQKSERQNSNGEKKPDKAKSESGSQAGDGKSPPPAPASGPKQKPAEKPA